MKSRRHMHRRRAGLIVNDDQNVGRDVVRMAASAERGSQQPPPFLRLSSAADDSGGGGVDWSQGVQHQPMEGLCRLGECGTEAACRNLDDGLQHICVCPHDLSPPTVDLKCPNRLTVPLTPRPIHNIIPPSGANLTNVIPPTPASNGTIPLNATISTTYPGFPTRWQRNGDVTMALVTLFSVAFGVVVLASVLCWCWRRRCARNEKNRNTANATTPLNLKKGLLVAERYTPNPHYSACASPCVPQLRRDMLRFHQEIGEGCFGKVYKGEFRHENNEQVEIVAIKVLKDTVSSEAEESFMREVDVMSAFRHPNILTLVGIVQRESGISPWMVFEYMPHGDLAEVLRSRGSRAQPLWQPRSCADLPHELTRTHLLNVALQIAAGMRYLAGQRFVHRDLACRNCLVGTNLIVKIADFGMSRDVYTCDYYKIGGSRLLPVRWMSPESVMYGRFTLESDVWSYGVVLWEIFSYGKQPYYGHNNEEVLKLILQGIMLIPPDDCPGEICDLMRCCWKTEPRDRIRFSEIHKRLEKMVDCCDDDDKLTSVDCCDDGTMASNNSSGAFDDSGGCSTTVVQLPRPPPVAQFNIDLLDPDGYLMPRQLTPCEYIQTLPD